MKYNITVLPGDGIGPEITAQAVGVIKEIGRLRAMSLFSGGLDGRLRHRRMGSPLPDETLRFAKPPTRSSWAPAATNGTPSR